MTVETLQQSLHAKAKSEPGYRFYSLWDKIWRWDVLAAAYERCRVNGGAAGIDGVSFDQIADQGLYGWLGNLQQELRSGRYRAQPLRRVWIPKNNGGQRPLGIPTIRDRVVQMATLIILTPIFEADLLPEQYGFRSGLDAKMAVRRVHFHLRGGRTEVVDGDLRDYFTTIPHGPLLKCVARRVSDGRILALIKGWLNAAVIERVPNGERRSAEARKTHRGTPQGGVISPLLANLYFRRFALALRQASFGASGQVRLVNYADDFVLCCRPGMGEQALHYTKRVMTKLGLEVHEQKTQLVRLPKEQFDFLGYSFGRFFGANGKSYFGTAVATKSLKRVFLKIHAETSRRWLTSTVEKRVLECNRILRGWCGYFNQGPIYQPYQRLRDYTERRLRRWLMKKHKRRGTGYRQYPDAYLYEKLGLFDPRAYRISLTRAKA